MRLYKVKVSEDQPPPICRFRLTHLETEQVEEVGPSRESLLDAVQRVCPYATQPETWDDAMLSQLLILESIAQELEDEGGW